MIEHISVVIITRNAGDTLAATLESAAGFANVVVWDNGSDDDTQAIAARFPNVDLCHGEFHGFGPAKNAAAACARADWVLSVDADERLTPNLVDELSAWDTQDVHAVGELERVNFLLDKRVSRGGWGNDWLVRLYQRQHHAFDTAAVHEKVALTDATVTRRLRGKLHHAAVRDLGQFLQKIDRYTGIRAQTSTRTYPTPVIFAKAVFAFMRSYVFQLGVLAGWRGLIIAWSNATGVMFKYLRIRAAQERR